MEDVVVLVDIHGRDCLDDQGKVLTAGKSEAHRKGLLHRAFSIFVFNTARQVLLQRRAEHKYHPGGLWSNTCCSHPRPGERIEEAAHRRLWEEMKISCPLREIYRFLYHAHLGGRISRA